jgi:hypothetical protein
MERTFGNSISSTPSTPNIEFLNGKERKERVNFLKFGVLGGLFGGVVEWNFMELNYND